MSLVRWEPAREIAALQHEVDRLFSSFFDVPANGGNGNGNGALRRWIPAMDLVETEDHFVLKADLPGMSHQDVTIEVEDRVLTIAGERKAEHEAKGEGYVRMERAFGAFRRQLTLPEGVDAEALHATFKDGVLELRIPKPEERKPRRVQIQVGDEPKTIEG
jgi:HSP20 family protein